MDAFTNTITSASEAPVDAERNAYFSPWSFTCAVAKSEAPVDEERNAYFSPWSFTCVVA
jgi:hypothetical protein